MSLGEALAERGWVPDAVIRAAIRRGLRDALAAHRRREAAHPHADRDALLAVMRAGPIAAHTADANAQHYEVPPALFELMLGPRLKYSSCVFDNATTTLANAEDAALALTCERAALADGQDVLELGCGWGSLTLWMAEHYPRSRILAVSNSAPQRAFIRARAAARGLENINVRTADMNAFAPGATFDRIVSVEMFEHMRNWPALLERIRGWLREDGALFLHVFSHATAGYVYDSTDPRDWMARHFFTGGILPTDDLAALCAPEGLTEEERWVLDGTHYARTARCWLEALDARRADALAILAASQPPDGAARQLQRWRMFVIACEEFFGCDGGRAWHVTHHRLRRIARATPK